MRLMIAILALALPLPALAEDLAEFENASARLGLSALEKLQKEDGHWGDVHPVAVTAICGMAILAVSEAPLADEKLWKGYKWLEARQKDGIWECDYKQWVHTQSFAVMFLAELVRQEHAAGNPDKKEATEGTEALLAKAVTALLRSQTADGGWTYESDISKAAPDASNSCCAIVALAAADRAGVELPRPAMERAIQFLKHLRKSDGSFVYTRGEVRSMDAGSACALAAGAVTMAFDQELLEKGVWFLKNRGWRMLMQGPHSEYASFFGMIAARRILDDKGEETKAAIGMQRDIRDELVRLQTKEGGWTTDGAMLDPSLAFSTGMSVLTLGMRRGKLGIVTPPEKKEDK